MVRSVEELCLLVSGVGKASLVPTPTCGRRRRHTMWGAALGEARPGEWGASPRSEGHPSLDVAPLASVIHTPQGSGSGDWPRPPESWASVWH